MRLGVRGSIGLLLACSGLFACGQSSRDAGAGGAAGSVAEGGSTNAGTAGTGAPGGSGGSGGSGGGGGSCVPNNLELEQLPVVELPARVTGTICQPGDTFGVSFAVEADDRLGDPIGVHLEEGAGPLATAILQNSENGPESLTPYWAENDSDFYALSSERRSFYFLAPDTGYPDDRVMLVFSGPPGFVALDVGRTELAPALNCDGEYEQFPVETPPLALPTVLEGELCNGRDSRIWAVNVAGGRPVTVTLENPLAIKDFTLGIHEAVTPEYDYLPVSSGETRVEMGLIANWTTSFTPLEAGIVAFSAGFGYSFGEAFRLRVDQP